MLLRVPNGQPTRDPPKPSAESVSLLFALVQRQVDDERNRGQGLDTKMSTLAGFTGAILALTATVAKEVFGLHLDALGNAPVRSVYVLAVVALGSAAICAVWIAIRPRPRLVIDETQLREFTLSMLAAPTVDIQGEMIETLFRVLQHERAANDRKARLGVYAGYLLIVGLAAVAVLAVFLGVGST